MIYIANEIDYGCSVPDHCNSMIHYFPVFLILSCVTDRETGFRWEKLAVLSFLKMIK